MPLNDASICSLKFELMIRFFKIFDKAEFFACFTLL